MNKKVIALFGLFAFMQQAVLVNAAQAAPAGVQQAFQGLQGAGQAMVDNPLVQGVGDLIRDIAEAQARAQAEHELEVAWQNNMRATAEAQDRRNTMAEAQRLRNQGSTVEAELLMRQLNARAEDAREEAKEKRAAQALERKNAEEMKHGVNKFLLGNVNDLREINKKAWEAQIDKDKIRTEAAIKGKYQKDAVVASTNAVLTEMTRPRNAALLVVTMSALFGIYKIGIPLINQYLQLPTLAQETSLESWSQKGSRMLFGAEKLAKKVSDVILEPQLASQIQMLNSSIKNTVRNGGFFRNILLYGPPGTGKTMLAMRLARSSGLEYIYFAASSLNQFTAEDALKKLHELFEYAKHSPKKLMIIIDESEKLFESRSKEQKDNKTAMLLNFLLTFLGTQNRDFLLVALTNRPQDLDGAFLSRCDEKIEIAAPGYEQRLGILNSYIDKLLVKFRGPQITTGLLSGVSSLFSTKKKKRTRRITVDAEVLEEDYLESIAERLEGLVGRDISKLIIGLQSKALATKACAVTKELFEQEVQRVLTEVANKGQWGTSYASVV